MGPKDWLKNALKRNMNRRLMAQAELLEHERFGDKLGVVHVDGKDETL